MFGFQKVRRQIMALTLAGLTTTLIVGCGGGSSVLANLAGTLDKTFGASSSDSTPAGIVSLSLGNGEDFGKSMAVQSDGKIIVVGNSTSAVAGLPLTTTNITVTRFNSDGTVDTSFGTGTNDGSPDGTVTLDLGDSYDEAIAVKIQSDGKIVVAGTSKPTNGTSNVILARLTDTGMLDSSFGVGNSDGTVDGVVAIDLGGTSTDRASALAIDSDGKIVVAGVTTLTGSSTNLMVARVNGDGTLDEDFGVDGNDDTPVGVVSVSLGDGDDVASGLVIQSDKKIVIAGATLASDGTYNAVLARLNTDGTLDTSFGTDANDGTPEGVVSVSFGMGNDQIGPVAIQTDGKIVVAGVSQATDNSTNMVVARFNSNGTLDTSFGTDSTDNTPEGVVGISLGNGNDIATGIAVQTDGKIVISGYSEDPVAETVNAAVARLLPNGQLDSSFGQDNSDGSPAGVTVISVGDGLDHARSLALQADGKILISGDRTNGGTSDIWLARFLAN